MNVKAKSCYEMTNQVISAMNDDIKLAKENNFNTEQVKALNLGNIVAILGAIAHSLATIADALEERRGK